MALPATPRTAPTHRGGPASSPAMWPGVGPVETIGRHCYQDTAGNVHVDVSALLRMMGAELTPANITALAGRVSRAVRQAAR
jgi:hypothetical protein